MAEVEMNPPQLAVESNSPVASSEPKEGGNRRGGKSNRENRKAPEELYDLTQPIPKVRHSIFKIKLSLR